MLASRLIAMANDIMKEYSDYKILNILHSAISIAANRANWDVPAYHSQIAPIKAQAQGIINKSKVERYPNHLKELLKKSAYAPALPERIAQVIVYALLSDKNHAMTSAELTIYDDLAKELISELGALSNAGKKFRIEPINIPKNEISLDLTIPRSLFSNRMDEFLKITSTFIGFSSYFIELTTGSEGSPELLYTSTSDPVTGLAMYGGAAIAILHAYNLLLEITERQLSIYKTMRDLRRFGEDDTDKILEKLEENIQKQLEAAIEKAVAYVPAKVPEPRINEIKIPLNKDAKLILNYLANGAKLEVTVESLENLDRMAEAVPGLTVEAVREDLKTQAALESRVEAILLSVNEKMPMLLQELP